MSVVEFERKPVDDDLPTGALPFDFGIELAAAAYHGEPSTADGNEQELFSSYLLDNLRVGEALTVCLRGGSQASWQIMGTEACGDAESRNPGNSLRQRLATAMRMLPALSMSEMSELAPLGPPGIGLQLIPDAVALGHRSPSMGFGGTDREGSDLMEHSVVAIMPALSANHVAPHSLLESARCLPPDVWLRFEFRREPVEASLKVEFDRIRDGLIGGQLRIKDAAPTGNADRGVSTQHAEVWCRLLTDSIDLGAVTTMTVRAYGENLTAALLAHLARLAWTDRRVGTTLPRLHDATLANLTNVVPSKGALERLVPTVSQLRAIGYTQTFRAPTQQPHAVGSVLGTAHGCLSRSRPRIGPAMCTYWAARARASRH